MRSLAHQTCRFFDVLRRAMVIMQHRFIVPLEADDYLGLGYSVKK